MATMSARVFVLLCVAGLHFAAAIFHHGGHMLTAPAVLQRCLHDSDGVLSTLHSHASAIAIDRVDVADVHFEPLTDAPLDHALIREVERVCNQHVGSATITSTRSFYLPCGSTPAAALASSPIGVSVQPSAAHHRMTSFEAAAVCSAAAQPGATGAPPAVIVATIAPDHGLSDVAAAFALALSQAEGFHAVAVQEESHTVLSFTCPAALAPRLSLWLLHRSLVRHLHHRPHFRLMNANAAWVVQSGVPQKKSVWAKGVRGKGQVVHVGDTGVDWNLCFFQSPGQLQYVPPPFFAQKASRSVPLSCQTDRGALNPSSSHKFASYITINGGDDRDEVGGHGTHVCGSVAGGAPSTSELSKHNGMAPEAQLSFTDLQGDDGGLSVPNDLCNLYFPCALQSGAFISSNSWGGGNNGYDSFAASLDQFTVDHDDMLVVFAAGNSGPGPYTVGTPSMAKNALAVGATTNPMTNSDVGLSNGIKFSSTSPPSTVLAAATLAQFAENPTCFGSSTFVVAVPPAADALGCNALCTPGSTPFANRFVLLQRGQCTFQSKAVRAIQCGAAAVAIINTDDQLLQMGGDNVSPSVGNVTVYLIKKSDGARLSASYSAFFPFTVTKPDDDPMAFFSSRGPTFDNRIKPDIVAPGAVVLSAKAMNADACTRDRTHQTNCSSCSGNGFCHPDPSVTTMMGTSMATPIVSGAAALVRQYFRDGLYPQGSVLGQGPGGFSPSSALMRAMLLASAQSVSPMAPARDNDPFSLNSIPSLSQGHGIIRLDSVLVFNDTAPLRMFAADRISIQRTGDSRFFAFAANAAMAPQVTLSWTDPVMKPRNPFHSVLVNDLDLELRSPSGQVVPGNLAQHVVNNVAYAIYDTDNNNERVVTHSSAAESGTWTVAVRANRLINPQQYSLVFSAAVAFNKVEPVQPLACPKGCSGTGTCLSGRCVCSDDRAGIACDMPILTAPQGQLYTAVSLKLNAMSWTFIRVPVVLGSIVTVMQRSAATGDGDADLYMVARKRGDILRLPTTVAPINQTSPPGRGCDTLCCNPVSGQAEPCPPASCTHSISFAVTDASVSEYVLGVTASCCDAASLDLSIDTRFNVTFSPCSKPYVPPTPSPNNAQTDAGASGALSVTKIVIIVGERSRRRLAFQL